jgi:hypothetical protein
MTNTAVHNPGVISFHGNQAGELRVFPIPQKKRPTAIAGLFMV